MGPCNSAALPSNDPRHTYQLRKCEEGYILTHSWQVERELTKKQKDTNPYPVFDYKQEEFAYTDLEDCIDKIYELVD